MDEKFRTKVATDLLKSGFGSEMIVLQVLRKMHWRATGLANFRDLDSKATRESDIRAHRVIAESADDDESNILYQSFFGLSIEVKKTSKPWIVIKEVPETPMELLEGWNSLIFCDGLKKGLSRGIGHNLGKSSLGNKLGWFGNGIHEAFKNPDQPSKWYSSFISVCKAAEHNLKQNSWYVPRVRHPDKSNEADHHPYMLYEKAVLVLDGQLCAAELNDKNNISIKEIEMCSIKFQFNTPNYTRREYVIDMVRIDKFGEYLRFCEARHEVLRDALLKIAAY